jgi:hypothetical protein
VSIAFPNVPIAPGVPPVARSAVSAISSIQGVVAMVSSDLGLVFGSPAVQPLWGVFDATTLKSVLNADSFLSFRGKGATKLVDFPIQNGAFNTYDKVRIPGTVTLRISKSGTVSDRAALLAQVNALLASITLYSVVTPEQTYTNMNMEDFELVRDDQRGAFFFTQLDLNFREIRPVTAVYTTTTSAPDLSNAQAPAAQPPANLGNVAPGTPSVGAQQDATTELAGGFSP